jgi:hypothetical protein
MKKKVQDMGHDKTSACNGSEKKKCKIWDRAKPVHAMGQGEEVQDMGQGKTSA